MSRSDVLDDSNVRKAHRCKHRSAEGICACIKCEPPKDDEYRPRNVYADENGILLYAEELTR